MRFNRWNPEVGEVTMCTVTGYEGSLYNVTLDEYDMCGCLPVSELSRKKIKVPVSTYLKRGTRLPLAVTGVLPGFAGIAFLSKKDVTDAEAQTCKDIYQLNNSLFKLPGSSDLHDYFMMLDKKCDPHPYIAMREQNYDALSFDSLSNRLSDSDLPSLITILKERHAKMFGIKPKYVGAKFTLQLFSIDGNSQIKRIMEGVRTLKGGHIWSDTELYECQDRANIDVRPIGLPVFYIRVTAYRKAVALETLDQIKNYLDGSGLDYITMDLVDS